MSLYVIDLGSMIICHLIAVGDPLVSSKVYYFL